MCWGSEREEKVGGRNRISKYSSLITRQQIRGTLMSQDIVDLISNKNLLFSTGNYIQYLVITYKEI